MNRNNKNEDYSINKFLFSIIASAITSAFLLYFIDNKFIILVLGMIIGSVITSNLFNALLDIVLCEYKDEELYNNIIIKFIRGEKNNGNN